VPNSLVDETGGKSQDLIGVMKSVYFLGNVHNLIVSRCGWGCGSLEQTYSADHWKLGILVVVKQKSKYPWGAAFRKKKASYSSQPRKLGTWAV